MDLKCYLACLIVLTVFQAGGALFRLKLGYEYIYKEEAECKLGAAGTIHVKAKVGFMPISRGKASIEILLTVHNAILQHSNGRQVPTDAMDFKNWFSFVIVPQHGDIEKVFHSSEEEPIILAMKKAFATMVFGKLHLHDDPMLKDVNHDLTSGKWNYSTYENGHEGLHKATYEAEPTARGIRFTKIRNIHHHVKAAANNYTKVLEFDSHLGLVRKVSVDEIFETGKAPKGFDPYENDRPELPTDSAINAEIPQMRSTSTGSAVIVTANRLKQVRARPETGLVEGLIHVNPKTSRKQENRTKTSDFDAHFRGNLSCLVEKDKSDGSTIDGVDCFAGLVRALKSLPDDDLISVTEQIFNTSKTLLQQLTGPSSASLHMVDALFDVGTDLSIRLLVEYGFASDPKTMKRMFAHFSVTTKPSFKVFDDELERYCFYPESFPDAVQDQETHQQALLLLGSLIKRHYRNGQRKSAHRLVGRLQNLLGFHDPYNYNKARSLLSKNDARRYDMHHVILLESLGNAGMEGSYDHIISYVNVSTHEVLRRSGLHALRSFNHDKAASVLYHAATQDESHIVRHESALILKRHPRSTMFPRIQPNRSGTSTLRPKEGPETREGARLQRMRRNIKDLFKPFTFTLEIPGVDWREIFGNTALGASIGVVMRNRLDLELGLLAGHAVIDIYDEAYARLHLGIIGTNFDLLLARVCFKGEVSYNLNVLQNMAQPLQRKLFTYNLKKDVVLLREVVSVNPYMDTGKWKEVLDNFVISLDLLKLNPGGSKPTERSCTDRIGNLIIKFNKAELASIRASGSDEELNERYELIREAKHLKEEAEIQNQKAKDKKRNKEQEDEAKAKEVRKRAMEGLGPVRKEDQSDEGRPAGKKQRATNVLLDYLREKNDKDVVLREREMQLSHERALLELKLREKELVLREKELSIKMETMKKN